LDVIALIEGAIVIDAPPPGQIQGVSTGVACLVGEFADMTYGVSVDSAGAVTTKPQPIEVFSSQDMLNKVGGWDETLGEFGVSGGNGFAALRNKMFSRLILVPVNLCSSKGIRLFRQLATNKSATDPTPVVPVQGATVAAGREFKSGVNRARIGQAIAFSSDQAYESGVDGAVTAAGAPAATQSFGSAGASFLTVQRPDGKVGVKIGDVVVIGQIGGALGLGSNAATYRVHSVTSAVALVLEKLDGSTFDWVSTVALPWRIHAGAAADSAPEGNEITMVGGYDVPARPLDATIPVDTILAPTVVPPAPAATSWDLLSGLGARTQSVDGLIYTAATQAPNAVASASFEALYALAIDSLLDDSYPARDVNIIWSARTDAVIRAKLKQHVLQASAQGVGRICTISPEVSQLTKATVLGDADPGVGANRDESVIYCWPGAQTFIPEAVTFNIKTALGTLDPTGLIDDRTDGWLAAVMSNLPPEQNPAQSGPPVSTVMAGVLGFQRGITALSMADYISFRQRGIVALKIDRTAGPIFQSGVTTSLVSGRKNINRRRMSYYIEDSVADRLNQFSKQLMTNQLKDSAVGEVTAFLLDLLSPDNPPAQRIAAFQVDRTSGNTPTSLALGVYVIIARVQTLASADFLVFNAEIGESVKVTTT
jgi:hypothetical protein